MKNRIPSLLTLIGLVGVGCSEPTAPVPIASIQVTAPNTTLASGAIVQLTATILGKNGKALTDRVVTWSSSNQSRAIVSSTGVVTAGNVLGGTAESVTITASSERVSGYATLLVNPVVIPPAPVLDTSTFAIPDTVLVSALVKMGLPIINGRMLTREATAVTQLAIGQGEGYRPPEGGLWTGTNGKYITDLTGLDKFTNLRTLRIEHQQITSIPLQAFPNLQLVSLWGNPITTLDVSRNTSLVTLGLSETGLTEIDVSNLSVLFEVDLQNDPDKQLPYTLPNGTVVRGFSKLDFSKNPGLARIYIWHNGLTSENLILSNNAKNVLTDFWAFKNKFTHLSFVDYKELSKIVLYDNQLETLDLRRVGQAAAYYVPTGLYTTENPRLLQIRVTNPGMTIQQMSLGAPIYIDPWTQFVP